MVANLVYVALCFKENLKRVCMHNELLPSCIRCLLATRMQLWVEFSCSSYLSCALSLLQKCAKYWWVLQDFKSMVNIWAWEKL